MLLSIGGKNLSSIKERTIQKQGMNIHFIQTKKFKTMTIVVKLCAPLQKETITKRALMPYLLNKGTKTYRSEGELQKKLDDLFGAHLSIDGMKKGDYHIISFRLELANEKFINREETVLKDALHLLHEVIFYPNIMNNRFQEDQFIREKETLKNEINSFVDDKTAYANVRLIDEMFKDDKYRLHVHGYEEDLSELTAENVYNYYEEMLQTNRLDIYVLGYFAEEEILLELEQLFSHSNQNCNELVPSSMIKHANKIQEVIEKEPINQAKLHIGYTTSCSFRDKNYFALHVFNGLFGSFPSSKLFVHVREQKSLAYYVSSRLESHKGLLIVFCGIDGKNFQTTKQIIDDQLKAMKQGSFTEDELEETKALVISELKETLDHPHGMIELSYQQVLGQHELSFQQLIEKINEVTKKDVLNVAKQINEHTVYLLKNERSDHVEADNI